VSVRYKTLVSRMLMLFSFIFFQEAALAHVDFATAGTNQNQNLSSPSSCDLCAGLVLLSQVNSVALFILEQQFIVLEISQFKINTFFSLIQKLKPRCRGPPFILA
jgi:hypothetical protein